MFEWWKRRFCTLLYILILVSLLKLKPYKILITLFIPVIVSVLFEFWVKLDGGFFFGLKIHKIIRTHIRLSFYLASTGARETLGTGETVSNWYTLREGILEPFTAPDVGVIVTSTGLVLHSITRQNQGERFSGSSNVTFACKVTWLSQFSC